MKRINIILTAIILIQITQVTAISLATHVPEKYTQVTAGERFYFEIEIKYPENPTRKDLILQYEILNQNNELIAQAKVLKAVETQASFIDFIVIPETANSGLYTLKITIEDYEDLSQEIQATFNITSSTTDQIIIYLIVILIAIILVGILVLISILKKK
jgi:hypothetical protein